MRARQPQSVVCEKQVIRADGTREPKTVAAVYYRNPLKRLWARRRRGVGRIRVSAA